MIEKYLQQTVSLISESLLTTSTEAKTFLGSEDKGHINAIIKLDDGSELHLFEYILLRKNTVVVEKYRYHWQNSSGNLIQRMG
ncbi:MAG: DUF6516 family protein [Candidatus Altiarchaeota archaeon]|nr:DUF6516 family protein [Candidatus Altiarchaeota archaeon]